jgi:hypothetical protein
MHYLKDDTRTLSASSFQFQLEKASITPVEQTDGYCYALFGTPKKIGGTKDEP